MNDAFLTAFSRFAGFRGGSNLLDRNGATNLAQEGTPLVTSETSRDNTQNLARLGYTHTHRFILLPSRNVPLWLLPLGNAQRTREAFEIYQPLSLKARVLKRLACAAINVGWAGWLRPRLLIASTEPLPLELLVSELTGERQPVFSLWIRSGTRTHKVDIQVMRQNGGILGYMKLALGDAAISRLKHEAEMLERLSAFPALRPHIPKLLYAGEWEDGYLLFQSCGPSGRGPLNFTTIHQQLLRILWDVHTVEQPGHLLVEEVLARWKKIEHMLDAEGQEEGRKALASASSELDRTRIRCGISHGDFVPPNTRAENERLFVFDWESAAWQAPNLWDVFHFHIRTGRRFDKLKMNGMADGRPTVIRASFALFLLNSISQLHDEEWPDSVDALKYKQQVLFGALARLSATR
jgi:hypothetical protein